MIDSLSVDENTGGKAAAPGGMKWLLHVIVLWSFAAAQPLYSKLSESIPFLLAHGLTGVELVAYSFGLLLIPPLALWLLVAATALLRRGVGLLFQRATVIVLVTMVLFPVLNRIGLPEMVALAVSSGLALIPGLLYNSRFWTGVLDILIPAPLLFAGIFLFFSPARLLLFGAGDAPSAPDAADDLDIPVVIVMLDEFSTQALLNVRGELDRERLPGFSRLADISTWYPRATTVVEATVMAAPVILSGILPEGNRHKPPVYQNFPENIFDQVSSERRIWAVENGSRLCRPNRCETADLPFIRGGLPGRWMRILSDSTIVYGHMILPDRLRARWLPELGTRWAGFAEGGGVPADKLDDAGPREIRWGRRQAEFEAFIEEIDKVGPGTMHYLHLLMPHAPWIYLPDGRSYDRNRGDSINGMMPDSDNATGIKHMWWDDEWATIVGEQRFLLQVHYVDQLVGRIVDRLSRNEHFARTMLIVASDHGGSFTPGTSRRALTEDNFAEILPIPLFIKYPGQLAAERSERMAELLDVSPTVREALGLGVEDLDGRPLQRRPTRPFRPRLVNEDGEQFEFREMDFEREFGKILQRMHERFSLGSPDRFVMIDSWADAYGQPIDRIGDVRSEATDMAFELENADQWRNYTPGAPFVPARLLGRLEGASEDLRWLLVTLNGRVAGFTRPFRFPDSEGLVEAMLWPQLLQGGGNELAVYGLVGSGDRILLQEIPVVEVDERQSAGRPDPVSTTAADVSTEAATVPIGDWIYPALLQENGDVGLRGDWHSSSGEIRWVGRDASVCFPVDDHAGPLELQFHAIPFLHSPQLDRQRLLVEVAGHSIAQISMEEERFKSYRVGIGAQTPSQSEPLCIRFRLPDAQVPRDLGAGADRRVLGVAFLKFRLVENQQR